MIASAIEESTAEAIYFQIVRPAVRCPLTTMSLYLVEEFQ